MDKLSAKISSAPLVIIFIFLMAGCGEGENARTFKRDGLREFVCSDRIYNGRTNSCAERSVWFEADTGLVAYITVYGIGTRLEAESISNFISDLKIRNGPKYSRLLDHLFFVARQRPRPWK
jgi:hypothetical protein